MNEEKERQKSWNLKKFLKNTLVKNKKSRYSANSTRKLDVEYILDKEGTIP